MSSSDRAAANGERPPLAAPRNADQADEPDEAIQAWIRGHTTEEVLAAYEEEEGAIAPISSIAEIVEDPDCLAREPVAAFRFHGLAHC